MILVGNCSNYQLGKRFSLFGMSNFPFQLHRLAIYTFHRELRLNSTIPSQQKLESIEIVELGQNFFIELSNKTFLPLSGAKNISLDNNRIQRIDNDAFSQ